MELALVDCDPSVVVVMTIAKSEDVRWIADELADLAVLLRVHGINDLADHLDAVRRALPEWDALAAGDFRRHAAAADMPNLDLP
jgi:hypothetical protein